MADQDYVLVVSNTEECKTLLRKVKKRAKLAYSNGLLSVRDINKAEKKEKLPTPFLLYGEYMEDDPSIIEKIIFHKQVKFKEPPVDKKRPSRPQVAPQPPQYQYTPPSMDEPDLTPSMMGNINFDEPSEDEENYIEKKNKENLMAHQKRLQARKDLAFNNELIRNIKSQGGELDLGEGFLGELARTQPSMLRGGSDLKNE
jgi:hypothetical protein